MSKSSLIAEMWSDLCSILGLNNPLQYKISILIILGLFFFLFWSNYIDTCIEWKVWPFSQQFCIFPTFNFNPQKIKVMERSQATTESNSGQMFGNKWISLNVWTLEKNFSNEIGRILRRTSCGGLDHDFDFNF